MKSSKGKGHITAWLIPLVLIAVAGFFGFWA